jgi:hypothetical protein
MDTLDAPTGSWFPVCCQIADVVGMGPLVRIRMHNAGQRNCFQLRYMFIEICLEARAGIEPACKDLQSSASPLRHRASTLTSAKMRFVCGARARH